MSEGSVRRGKGDGNEVEREKPNEIIDPTVTVGASYYKEEIYVVKS